MPKYNLSSEQWDELIQQYVQLVVDSMDYKSLEEFVTQTITQDLSGENVIGKIYNIISFCFIPFNNKKVALLQ